VISRPMIHHEGFPRRRLLGEPIREIALPSAIEELPLGVYLDAAPAGTREFGQRRDDGNVVVIATDDVCVFHVMRVETWEQNQGLPLKSPEPKILTIPELGETGHCDNCGRKLFWPLCQNKGRALPLGWDINNKARPVQYYGFFRWVCGWCWPTALEPW
jgi:hypothetical protein